MQLGEKLAKSFTSFTFTEYLVFEKLIEVMKNIIYNRYKYYNMMQELRAIIVYSLQSTPRMVMNPAPPSPSTSVSLQLSFILSFSPSLSLSLSFSLSLSLSLPYFLSRSLSFLLPLSLSLSLSFPFPIISMPNTMHILLFEIKINSVRRNFCTIF